MGVDRKYGHVTTQRGDIGGDEPVVVFRAQDRLLPELLVIYRTLCETAGSPRHHLYGIDRSIETVEAWQSNHPTKTPSSDMLAGPEGEST